MAVAEDVGIELYGRVALALEAERRSALHCRWCGRRRPTAVRPYIADGLKVMHRDQERCQDSLAMLMIINVLSDISRDSA
jgi:hypothetical protein